MLEKDQLPMAVKLAARHIKTEGLQKAVEFMARSEPSLISELGTINALISQANTLISSKSDETRDLKAISKLKRHKAKLPELFSWRDRYERHAWSKSLVTTLKIVDTEIEEGYYTHPSKINSGAQFDVFRFYLLDGYGRWFATAFGRNNQIEEDRDLSELVVNALCEAAVVRAESHPEGRETVAWLVNRDWLEEKWGFTRELVQRSKLVASQPH